MFPSDYFVRTYFDAYYFPDAAADGTPLHLPGIQFRAPDGNLQFDITQDFRVEFRVPEHALQFTVTA